MAKATYVAVVLQVQLSWPQIQTKEITQNIIHRNLETQKCSPWHEAGGLGLSGGPWHPPFKREKCHRTSTPDEATLCA